MNNPQHPPQYPPQYQPPAAPQQYQPPAAPAQYQQPPAAPQQYQQQQAPQQYQQQQAAPVSAAQISALGAELGEVRQGNASGRYLPPGKYVWDVTKVKLFTGSEQDLYFIMDTVIVESDNPEVSVGDTSYGSVSKVKDKYGHGKREIKDFICQAREQAFPGSNPGVNWEAGFVDWALSAEQPMVGTRWYDEAWEQTKKKAPAAGTAATFTKHSFTIMQPGEVKGLSSGGYQPPAAAPPAQYQPPAAAAPAQYQPPQYQPPAAPAQYQPPVAAAPAQQAAPSGWPAGIPVPPNTDTIPF